MDFKAFKKRAEGKKEQFNKTFKQLRKLKDSKVDALFHDAHNKVFSEINCLECAACCTHVGPLWTKQDIKRVSKVLKIKEGDFESTYLKFDEDNDHVFQSMPCPFLETDNKCMIYEDRPKACREYPHTDRKKMKQIFKLTLKNTSCCPAVEQIMDKFAKKH